MGTKLFHVEGQASLIGSMTNNLNVWMNDRRPTLPKDAERVVDRFQQLLDGHGLNRAQLLRLVPDAWGWTLGNVSDPLALLNSLSNGRISWLAALFGIREEWLSGHGDKIYDWPNGYKQPEHVASTIAQLGWIRSGLRMTVLASNYRTGKNGPLGMYTIVFSFPIAEWDKGEITINRHLCFDHSPMDWGHPPCRFDAMALARWFHCHANLHEWIPIVSVARKDVDAIAEGTAFPGPLIPWGLAGFDNLEDRVLRPGEPHTGEGESVRAIENQELEAVMKYFNCRGLAAINGNTKTIPG